MDWLTLLSSAAIGSVLTLVGKELFDFLRAERSHRNELQKRYFDAKLLATLSVIREMKTASSSLRAVFRIMKENDDTKGWIHPQLLNSTFYGNSETLKRIGEETAGAAATLGFYYDNDVVKLVEASGSPVVPLLQKLSELMVRAEQVAQAEFMRDSPTPEELRGKEEEIKELAEKVIAFHRQEARDRLTEISQLCDAIDELTNEIVRKMRDEYRSVSFGGSKGR